MTSTNLGKAIEWSPTQNVPGGILDIRTARAPIDPKGNVAICPSGYSASSNVFQQIMLLSELKEEFRLPTGRFYAIKVEVKTAEEKYVTSDWVVVKIE